MLPNFPTGMFSAIRTASSMSRASIKMNLPGTSGTPHVNWLLEESKNKSKFNVLIDYVVHQALRKGEIY